MSQFRTEVDSVLLAEPESAHTEQQLQQVQGDVHWQGSAHRWPF